MREPDRAARALRIPRIEAFEPRLVMSAQPVGELVLDAFLEQQAQPSTQGTLAEAHTQTGLTQARTDYGFTGAGQTVVVIDTGIGYDHTSLGGGFGGDFRVVGGWDFAENDANPYDDGTLGSHGTHVAGIIGSNHSIHTGVAPGVDLVSLRVFNDAAQGSFDWIEQALQWVHANRDSFDNPITTVNISIGTAWNSSSVPNWSKLEDDFAQLKADGIFTAVAAGNSFAQYNAPGLSYPAASNFVVPVSSVDANGSMSSFSQRDSRVIAAPGRSITSTVPDYRGNMNGRADDFVSYSGTSMASPYVAGASVLIRQAFAFAGQENVNQDTIYNHMRSTADSVFDSATGQSYSRLNLGQALDAIMPDDDFGSTAATAHGLGTVTDGSEVTGHVARLGDQDFFTFTAGRTGMASLTLEGDMQASWSHAGLAATVSGGDGQTLSFGVVAGQTYTIGIGSANGLGHYVLEAGIEGISAYTDWGAVVQQRIDNQQIPAGGQQFAMTASRDGLLTIEANFAHARGNIDLEVYNRAGELVGSSRSTGGAERIDVRAAAGETFYLRVVGQNQDVDFRLTNLVSESGGTVTVNGTSAADEFQFLAGTTHQVSVNGVSYRFAAGSTQTVRFAGQGGADSISLTGSTGSDTATLRPGSVQLVGSGYRVEASGITNAVVQGGGGRDTVNLYDSAGNDTLTLRPGEATMSGAGFSSTARGFSQVRAYASGGVDRATMYDSAGNDSLVVRPTQARMTGTGFDNTAFGFDSVRAYASAGNDQAVMYDSAGNDVLTARRGLAQLTGTGFDAAASGFDRVQVYASGGTDRFVLTSAAGDTSITNRSDYARLYGGGSDIYGYRFDVVQKTQAVSTTRLYAANWEASISAPRVASSLAGLPQIHARALASVNESTVAGLELSHIVAGQPGGSARPTDRAGLDRAVFDRWTPSLEAVGRQGARLDAQAELIAIDELFKDLGREASRGT